MRKIACAVVLVLLLAALASGCTQATESKGQGEQEQKTYTMRIGYATSNDSHDYVGTALKREIEKSLGGRVKVELFPNGQLGSNSQMTQNVIAGSLEAVIQPTAFLGGFDPVVTVLDLPYLFEDTYEAAEAVNGPRGDELREHLLQKGMAALGFYQVGPYANLIRVPVEEIGDLKGLKIRVMESKMLVDEMAAIGVAGVPMGVPELFTALQQRTVDGVNSQPTFFYLQKYYQVAKYILQAPKAAMLAPVLVNADWFNGLP